MTLNHFIDFSSTRGQRDDYQVAAEKLLSGNPQQATISMFSDPREEFHCGIWQGEPARWKVSYSENEYCHILEGSVRITDDQGSSVVVNAGGHFVISAGFRGTWETLTFTKKIYVIFEHRADT
jgi:uncharacterized protein